MSTTGVKVVLDTNIFITIFSRKSPARWIFEKIMKGEFELCISTEILLEYEEIVAEKLSPTIAANLLDLVLTTKSISQTNVYFSWGLIQSDPEDNKFVDCYISSGAYCIVTNDKHFKELKEEDFPYVKVLSLEEFEAEFKMPG
ncbi:MAG: putative toxin-antitoxin system toxin component, PIN family [Bacteroidales bacterium]|nr:putative toxin-antitoxin system toxin component, PIN family [Bacteroidales bacterium]